MGLVAEAWEPDFSISLVARRKGFRQACCFGCGGLIEQGGPEKLGGVSRFRNSDLHDPCDVIVMFVLGGIF